MVTGSTLGSKTSKVVPARSSFGMLHTCPPAPVSSTICFALRSLTPATDNFSKHALLTAGNKDGISSAVTDSYIVLEG